MTNASNQLHMPPAGWRRLLPPVAGGNKTTVQIKDKSERLKTIANIYHIQYVSIRLPRSDETSIKKPDFTHWTLKAAPSNNNFASFVAS